MTPAGHDPSETAHLRELYDLKIEALRDMVALKITEGDKALRLQAEEYERRLSALNNEQARLAADRERFLPREVFDSFLKDTDIWRNTVNRFMAATSGRDSGIGVAWTAGIAAIGLLGGVGCGAVGLLVTVGIFLVGRT